MWNSFKTYELSPEEAFEIMCNQLFERYVYNNHEDLIKFRVINGSGGDGGIEAYALLKEESIIAVQSKWFRNNLDDSQINQIKNSVITAVNLRPNIKTYIVCIPRNINSLKIGKGKKPIKNSEESKINTLIDTLLKSFPDLEIQWWFEHQLSLELLKPENEGIHKYWFEREIIFFNSLKEKFQLQKTNSWLRDRYVPNLNTSGLIYEQVNKQLYSKSYRQQILNSAIKTNNYVLEFELLLNPLIKYSSDKTYAVKLAKVGSYLQLIKSYIEEIKLMTISASETKLDLSYLNENIFDTINELRDELKVNEPENLQKPYYDGFILKLDLFESEILYSFYKLCEDLETVIYSLILGKAGTGKTHGLAFSVEESLNNNSPAILIRAYGADSSSWTSLLSKELSLTSWTLNEIFSALETLAVRGDVKKASFFKIGEEPNFESSKVLICVDGLEEDITNWENWYDRINEINEFSKKYPRLRFLFSARNYFYNNRKILNVNNFQEINLPREGDVLISDILNKYLKHYNITIGNISLIKGLDSLFALRLFCEEYKNSEIKESSVFETATEVLLKLKLKRLNEEFLKLVGKSNLDISPIVDSLIILSELFYEKSEVEHNKIREKIDVELLKYLDNSETERLLQFLSESGIITKFERQEGKGLLKSNKKYYSITYQSILEIVISDHISRKIIEDNLLEFPELVFKHFALPPDVNPIEFQRKYNKTPNQQLIQNVVNYVFISTEKLIGIDGFLSKGFSQKEIFEMQLEALIYAPYELSNKYIKWIDSLLMNSYSKRLIILKNLIFPLANRNDSPFNAIYFHNILFNFKDCFSRDKFWSGLDSYEESIKNESEVWDLTSVLNIYKQFSKYEKFNGIVLLYAWGLSTIDQKLRETLRVKITKWAILVPNEFLKLLELLYPCNDPQIKEDLASITLGIASKSKDKEVIKKLAEWSLKNIFEKLDFERNVIVRHGFMAVIERAYQFKLISKIELNKIKSNKNKNKKLKLLPLDLSYLKNPKEEFYPIVHDLSWYVIKYSYENFLTYNIGYKNNDVSKETNSFLNTYKLKYKNKYEIHIRSWAMSAALKYIKSLGFNRKTGNGFTQASHGSRSKIFTYEEKYTWLAVNYIKGYLTDYLPYNYDGDKFWLNDYSLITEIHNPSEDFENELENQVDEMFNPTRWIMPETLSYELPNIIDIQNEIEEIVNNQPKIDFSKWIFFEKEDFDFLKSHNIGSTLYNYTSIFNSTKTIKTSIEIQCCVMQEKYFNKFKQTIINNPNTNLLRDDLHFYAIPKTDTYSNPSDVVWMDWIEEDGAEQYFSDEITFYTTLSRVVKKNVSGEKEVFIPSRLVCKNLGIIELDNKSFLSKSNEILGKIHTIETDVFGESQEIIVVNDTALKSNLAKKKLIRFWLALVITNKNPLNESIKKIKHFQKVRKYIIWQDGKKINSSIFWEGRFSNQL